MASGEEIRRATELLARARRPVAFTGAGVSAESGIPTFRGSGGLWENYRVEDVATPEAFERNPRLVWEFYNLRREAVFRAEPNPAHRALARLEELFPNFVLITQNVDRLHQRAGSKKVIELHGNLCEVRCTGCGRTFDKTGVRLEWPPRCAECGELLRPAVVWFGEALPLDAWRAAEEAANASDCMLVIGTSAQVYPAAGLIAMARRHGAAIVEVNLEPTAASEMAAISIYGKAAEVLPQIVEAIEWARQSGEMR